MRRAAQVAEHLLERYYDDMYRFQASKRPNFGETVPCETGDALENAKALLAALAARGC